MSRPPSPCPPVPPAIAPPFETLNWRVKMSISALSPTLPGKVVEKIPNPLMSIASLAMSCMLPADELSSLLESIHLLKSPANAKRLLNTIQKAKGNQGTIETIDQLKDSLLNETE